MSLEALDRHASSSGQKRQSPELSDWQCHMATAEGLEKQHMGEWVSLLCHHPLKMPDCCCGLQQLVCKCAKALPQSILRQLYFMRNDFQTFGKAKSIQ